MVERGHRITGRFSRGAENLRGYSPGDANTGRAVALARSRRPRVLELQTSGHMPQIASPQAAVPAPEPDYRLPGCARRTLYTPV